VDKIANIGASDTMIPIETPLDRGSSTVTPEASAGQHGA